MNQILTTLFLSLTLLSFGQSYEGILTYVADFEVSESLIKMGMTKEMLRTNMKSEDTWSDTIKTSYKQGNYHSLHNSHPKSWAVYKAEANKIFTLQDGDASDLCTVTNAGIDLEHSITGKMPSVEKLDTSAIVDGVSCSIVRVKWKTGTYDYYYNPTKLVVDASLFANHIYDGWAAFLKLSNALPLKIVKTTKGMLTVTVTLISAKPVVIDENIFFVPKLLSDPSLNVMKIANREVMRVKK